MVMSSNELAFAYHPKAIMFEVYLPALSALIVEIEQQESNRAALQHRDQFAQVFRVIGIDSGDFSRVEPAAFEEFSRQFFTRKRQRAGPGLFLLLVRDNRPLLSSRKNSSLQPLAFMRPRS
jgi:hypothetical protein